MTPLDSASRADSHATRWDIEVVHPSGHSFVMERVDSEAAANNRASALQADPSRPAGAFIRKVYAA